jgi:hypothetical protein
VEGERVGMVDCRGDGNGGKQHVATIRMKNSQSIVVPARTVQLVHLEISDEANSKLQPEKSYVMESQQEVPGLNFARAVIKGASTRHLITSVVNSTESPIVIPPDTIVGRVGSISDEISPDEREDWNEEIEADMEFDSSKSKMSQDEFEAQLEKSISGSVLDATQKHELKSLLRRYRDRFAPDPSCPGTTDVVVHTIDTGQSKPMKSAPARVSPRDQEVIKEKIDEMLKAGIIEPSRSPWASRIVMVRKKDGTARFCVDYRNLNEVTVKDSYPLPHQTDLMDAISDAIYFSTMDLAAGYWQIRLDDDAKEKSAFASRFGFYQFTVMPFGLTNAPATFQRMMDVALSGLTWIECMVYLDDIIIFGRNWKEHLDRLQHVMDRLREFKLVAKLSKCHFGAQSIKFLGHVVTAAGLGTDPDKVKAIRELPYP